MVYGYGLGPGYGNDVMFGQQRRLRRYGGPGQMMQAQLAQQQRQIAMQQQQIAMQQHLLRRQSQPTLLGAIGNALTGGALGGPPLPPPPMGGPFRY